MPTKDYINFVKSFHHHGDEFDYYFTEIATRMQEFGIVRDDVFGYYIQAPIKIFRGIKIKTPKDSLVKIIFKKVRKTGGYKVEFKR
mgnify:CR=1 FL=1